MSTDRVSPDPYGTPPARLLSVTTSHIDSCGQLRFPRPVGDRLELDEDVVVSKRVIDSRIYAVKRKAGEQVHFARCVEVWRPVEFERYLSAVLWGLDPESSRYRQLERVARGNAHPAELTDGSLRSISPDVVAYTDLQRDVAILEFAGVAQVWSSAGDWREFYEPPQPDALEPSGQGPASSWTGMQLGQSRAGASPGTPPGTAAVSPQETAVILRARPTDLSPQ